MEAPERHRETELKLVLSPADAARTDFAALFGPDGKIAQQLSTYFDTGDRRLRKQGWSLRVRSVGTRRIQTAKRALASAVGLFSRGEWEGEIGGDHPVVSEDGPLPDLLGDATGDLKRVFSVEVERRSWNFVEGQARIEVVVDRGRVLAGRRRQSFCEIELELIDGQPDELFDLARRLTAMLPLRLGVLSKWERGYRLLDGKTGPVKSEAIALDGAMTAAEAFALVGQSCLRQFRLNEDLMLRTGEAGAVHQARVALRRLRSALVLFRPVLKTRARKAINERLRAIAGVLGDVRNIDVLMPDLSDEALSTARAARVAAHARACAMLRTHDTRLFFLDLSQWLASGSLCRARHRDMTLPALAVEGLSGLYGLVSDQGEDIQTVSDEDRHDIRKAAKKLRYSAEFLASLYDERKQRKARVRFLAALELLQDYLGDLNDASVRPALLAELGIDAPPVDEADQNALLKGAARAMEGLREQGPFWERWERG